MRPTFSRPVHVADNAAERKLSPGVAAGELLKDLQHSILIETAVPEVCFGVAPKLKLAALLGGCRVNSCRREPLNMLATFIRINDVNRLVATLESGFDKR